MDYNDKTQNLKIKQPDIIVIPDEVSLNHKKEELTNEQKLEYLSKLIQEADRKAIEKGITKKMVK